MKRAAVGSLLGIVGLSSALQLGQQFQGLGQQLKHRRSTNLLMQEEQEEQEEEKRPQGTRNPLRLAVLKLGATEPAFSSPLNGEMRAGDYACAGCGKTIFMSEGKYSSGCGWPAFYRSAGDGAVSYRKEWDGRVEVRCQACEGHLGHVFGDGPRASPDEVVPETDPKCRGRHPRFCINGASLKFNPADERNEAE